MLKRVLLTLCIAGGLWSAGAVTGDATMKASYLSGPSHGLTPTMVDNFLRLGMVHWGLSYTQVRNEYRSGNMWITEDVDVSGTRIWILHRRADGCILAALDELL